MENDDRPLARWAEFYRSGYAQYVELMYTFYGGESAAKTELMVQSLVDAQEPAP